MSIGTEYEYRVVCADGTIFNWGRDGEGARAAAKRLDIQRPDCGPHRLQRLPVGTAWEDVPDALESFDGPNRSQ